MTKRRIFPASILDEVAYCVERIDRNPLIFGMVLTLEGEVSTRVVKETLDACLDYYPKFKCILVKDYPSFKRWFRFCWEYRDVNSEDILQEIEDLSPDHDSREAINFYIKNYSSLSIDLACQVPLKVLLIKQLKLVNLIFIFHHAAVDGLGGVFFVQKFVKFYEENFYQQKKVGDYTPDFKTASQPEITFRWKNFSLRRIYAFLKYSLLLLREPSARLHAEGAEVKGKKVLAVVREIPPHQFKLLRTTARKYNATVNEYLLAAMFQTIKKWNQRWGDTIERIYIGVPVNLRPSNDRMVGNNLSGFNISLTPDLIGDKEKILGLIRKEMTSMMKNDIARTTVNLAWFMKLIPLWLKMFISNYLSHSSSHLTNSLSPTFLLTNLGIFSPNLSHKDKEGFHYMGSARIHSASGIPPVGQWPGMGTFIYNGRITFSLGVLRSQFSLEAAERFLESFISELIG